MPCRTTYDALKNIRWSKTRWFVLGFCVCAALTESGEALQAARDEKGGKSDAGSSRRAGEFLPGHLGALHALNALRGPSEPMSSIRNPNPQCSILHCGLRVADYCGLRAR
jgi:hypothetical protein